jgi:hypothetical protein
MNLLKLLPYAASALLAAATVCPIDANAGSSRQPVHGTPLICGKKIEQFVLLQAVDFTPTDHYSGDPIHGFPKGLFLPVSEDGWGVFYHAANGVVTGRPYPPFEHTTETGGIYVSKARPGVAYGYLGDARKPAADLTQMSELLRKDVLEKFLVGHAAPSRKAKDPHDRQ